MKSLQFATTEKGSLGALQVAEVVVRSCPEEAYRGKSVLLIVPDGTRTAPVGTMFKALHACIGGVAKTFDVLIALGTHQPMNEAAICKRLEISENDRREYFGAVGFYNHEWDNPAALTRIGTLSAAEVSQLTEGLFSIDVAVEVNRKVFEYDKIIIVGPVFPHEVVGFSGGNKYLFPGVGGPEVLNFFHWVGALVTNPMIIGNKWTPVRKVVDKAASLVRVPKRCFCMVVTPGDPAHGGGGLAALSFGDPVSAWDLASEVSKRVHITYKDRPFHTVLSCAPKMYDEMWVGGKCMYKLEPVVADGGELIIYAPHIREISRTHGALIQRIGYHTRDYFLRQWSRFKGEPWGILAHSTHVRGVGSYANGVEKPRVQVTLATQIPEDVCRAINLGYRDPRSINVADYQDREDEGVLYVPKAGEMLYRLKHPPEWARG